MQFLASYESLKAAVGDNDRRAQRIVGRLADLHEAWGRPEQAAEWAAELSAAEAPDETE